MKMIYCTGNIEILEDFHETLEEQGVENYQIIDRVLAQSENSQPRFDTPVWPGYNFSVLIQVKDNERAKSLIKLINNFNTDASRDSELITYCSWSLEKFGVD